MTARIALSISATVELVTLALLLTNLATLHLPAVSQILGPVHGMAYLGTIVAAALTAGGHHPVWLLSLIPGVGGVLALRAEAGRRP